MAIVWVCKLGVDAYEQLGRGIDVPRFACPFCGEPMVLWGFYRRYLRIQAWCRLCLTRRLHILRRLVST